MNPKGLREKQNTLYYAVNRYLNSEIENAELARIIINGYGEIRGRFRELTAPQTIEAPRINILKYKNTPYFKALKKLNSLLKPAAFGIKTFLVHGSIATMDFIPGWSDFDTFVIVKREIFQNQKRLIGFRGEIIRAKAVLKKFDPLAHHGFIFLNEENLLFYPQHYMPVSALRYSKSLIGEERITFQTRDNRKEAEENFYHYYDIFRSIARTGAIKNKPGNPEYQLKWFISMLLLMPSIYLQAKGIYLYKKFSFDFVRHPFLDKLSKARKNFPKARGVLGKNMFKSAVNMLQEWSENIQAHKRSRKFSNHPKKIPLSVYREARNEISAGLRENPDVISLYEYGSVGAPGISDLDLIVVTKDRLSRKFSRPEGPNIEKVAKGTLMVMPEEVFSQIQLFDAVRLKRRFGKKIRFAPLPNKLRKTRDIATIIDWLPERMIRLVAMLHSNPLDVQYALRYTRSFAYSLENTGKLIGWNEYKDFLDKLMELRRSWKKRRATDLKLFISQGLALGYEALERFTERYAKSFSGAEGSLTIFDGQKIIFTGKKEEINADWSFAHSRTGEALIFADKRLAAHFSVYSREKNILAQEMRKKILLRDSVRLPDAGYKNFLKLKMALAARAANFLIKNKLEAGLYRFGFYLPKR